MTPRQQRIRLIRNGRACLKMMRAYRTPMLRGFIAGHYVLIKQELKKLREQSPESGVKP